MVNIRPVNYDDVAPTYDRRYQVNRYDGIAECLAEFLDGARRPDVAEVGCGTGHWLELVERSGRAGVVAGLDLSAAMLASAHEKTSALLARGTADQLPWGEASFDRVFCINALHHFARREEFLVECARVLRMGGAMLTIGLDPHSSGDSWWIYDYFPSAREADRARYSSSAAIREALERAGFRGAETHVAQQLPASRSFEEAEAEGLLDRHTTSQLMVIADDEWTTGLERLRAERPILRADLRLYATTAWR